MDGLLMVSGRRHNADDIVATGLAVESIKTVYRGRWVIQIQMLALPMESKCIFTGWFELYSIESLSDWVIFG